MTTWNNELWETLHAIYDRQAGTAIEQYCLRKNEVFSVDYTNGHHGRRTFHEMERLFRNVNEHAYMGLSDVVRKITFVPTHEVLFSFE